MATLMLKQVNKHYEIKSQDSLHALVDIDLAFESGEMVAIVGESGSGKSTLMNVLGGLDSDFTGEVLFDGRHIGAFREKERVKYHKEKVGFVFQNFNLIPHLSVLDNVMLSMTLSNVDKATRTKRAHEALKRVGLEKQYRKKPNQLSGGQKQRVAIARALVNDPEVIIADEPTGSLDSKTTDQVLDILEVIAQSGKLVLIVTHSEQVALRCSRVVTIADGVILSDISSARKAAAPTDGESIFTYQPQPKHKNLNLFAAIGLALKNMREKWLRNLLITLGGSIGIMSIILMLSLGEGVNGYLMDTMTSTVNPLVTQVHMPKTDQDQTDPTAVGPLASTGGVTGMAKDIIIQDPAFPAENIEELRQIEGVTAVERGFQSTRIGGNTLTLDGEKYSFMNLHSISSALTEASILAGTLPSPGEIMVTERFAQELQDPIGKSVELSTIISGATVTGTYTISGIYTSGGSISPNALADGIYMDYGDIEALAGTGGVALAPNVLYLVSDAETTAKVKEHTQTLGYAQSTTDAITDIFSQMIALFSYVLAGVAGISLVVSAILIATVLFMSVLERTNEIGVIKAIGGRCKDIRRIFVSEALLIGLFSGLVAVGSAALVATGTNALTNAVFRTDILLIKPQFAAAGVCASIIISALAGLLPAMRAARLDPVESLRHE